MKKLIRFLAGSIIVFLCVLGISQYLHLNLTALNWENVSIDKLTEAEDVDDVKEWYYDQMGELVVGEAVTVESISYDRYAYQQLNEDTKEVYDQVLSAILNYKEKVVLSTKNKDVLELAFQSVKADYGNLFWVNGYVYNTYTKGDQIISLEFTPSYTMSQEIKEDTQRRVDEVAMEWLSGISNTASDYDKAKYVFETLINNAEYNVNSVDNQNMISVFLNRETVCQGYADAAWYLLDALDIPCTVVTGMAAGEPHAWNLIYLDGAYYYMDVTWGNSKYRNLDSSQSKHINYAYLAFTTEEMGVSHTLDCVFEVPECVSNADNYFIKEGKFFDSWDMGAIGRTIERSWDSGEEELCLKFSTPEICSQTVEYFVTEMHLTDFCWGIETVSYLIDEKVNVITFIWK